MSNKLSDKEQMELIESMRKAKELEEMRLAKEEAKRWTPIESPLSLADALARLTKQELTAIRTELNIAGVSSLNKQDLADKLAELIPQYLGGILERFDEERYQVVKKAADRRDAFPALGDPYKVSYFLNLCLLFPGTQQGKRVLVMPQEIKAGIKSFDSPALKQKIRANTQLIRLVTGMLAYYGVLDTIELWKMVAPHHRTEMSAQEFDRFVSSRADFAGGWQIGPYGIADEAVVDPEGIVREHRSRSELPYYPFTTEQLLEAGVPDFIDRNLSYRSFVNFIMGHYSVAKEEADEVVAELTFQIQNGDPPSMLIEFLQERFDMSEREIAEGFVGHLTELNNNTRLWVLKGHTPNELSPALPSRPSMERREPKRTNSAGNVIDIATGRKIGRNDPCPCGSGKKFKKCCGG